MRALKIATVVLIGIVGFFVAYYSYWQYQWERSKTHATAFCESVAVGSDIATATARAKAMDRRVIDGQREGEKYLAVLFPGPIFNQFICELIAADGKVTAKRVLEDAD